MIDSMNQDIQNLYKEINVLKDATKLLMLFPVKKQEELLEYLMDNIDKDNDDKTIFFIIKIYLHFIQFGAEDHIRQDALTCLLMIKSFSIKQDKQAIQYQCFLTCFRLLYARFLNDDQKGTCLEELNEFYKSKKEHIRWLLIVFYFDDKHNPYFNILKKRQLTDETFQYLCDSYLEIVATPSCILPLLPDDKAGMAIETLEQRFYNQFVYGEIGLHATPYQKSQARYVINTLILCAKANHDRSHIAKKGIIKHLDFLLTQLKNAESKDQLDTMILFQEDIDLIKTDLSTISFGKLETQLHSALAKESL